MTNHIKENWFILHAPTHSDNIVYWTGRDIMQDHGNLSANEKSYKPEVVKAFLDRLKDILKYGLWMTKRTKDDFLKTRNGKFLKPNISRICFTELKLSDSLLHAKNFGPLGIGFKRFFLINRLGSPVYYVSEYGFHLFFPPHSSFYNPSSIDYEMFCFFKNMSSGRDVQNYITYDLYEESEWRIIYSENIKQKIPQRKREYFIDPKPPSSGKYHDFYKKLTSAIKPEYLVPVDEWLALIIYPNLQIKNAAQDDTEIRDLLSNLKNKEKLKNRSLILAEGIPDTEVVNFPAEISIGAIKNF